MKKRFYRGGAGSAFPLKIYKWMGSLLCFCLILGLTGCGVEEDRWVVTSYADATGQQAAFYTITNEAEDALIVIDGGNAGNEEAVRKVIKSYGNHVDAWIVTHYHPDHVDAFNAIFRAPGKITVDAVYDSPMDYTEYLEIAQDWDGTQSFTDFREITKDWDNVHAVERNQEIDFGDLDIKFLNSYDDLSRAAGDIPNSCSLTFMVKGPEKRMLFMSDAGNWYMGDLMERAYGKELKADFLQAPHHGNNTVDNSFYETVDPEVIFLDAPEWLVTGEQFHAKDLVKYCEDNGIAYYDWRTAPNSVYLG